MQTGEPRTLASGRRTADGPRESSGKAAARWNLPTAQIETYLGALVVEVGPEAVVFACRLDKMHNRGLCRLHEGTSL